MDAIEVDPQTERSERPTSFVSSGEKTRWMCPRRLGLRVDIMDRALGMATEAASTS